MSVRLVTSRGDVRAGRGLPRCVEGDGMDLGRRWREASEEDRRTLRCLEDRPRATHQPEHDGRRRAAGVCEAPAHRWGPRIASWWPPHSPSPPRFAARPLTLPKAPRERCSLRVARSGDRCTWPQALRALSRPATRSRRSSHDGRRERERVGFTSSPTRRDDTRATRSRAPPGERGETVVAFVGRRARTGGDRALAGASSPTTPGHIPQTSAPRTARPKRHPAPDTRSRDSRPRQGERYHKQATRRGRGQRYALRHAPGRPHGCTLTRAGALSNRRPPPFSRVRNLPGRTIDRGANNDLGATWAASATVSGHDPRRSTDARIIGMSGAQEPTHLAWPR